MMDVTDTLEVTKDAVWTMIVIGAPVMLVALIVGLVVSLFQALTQIQEMTLAFVPKIVCTMLALLIALPFMLNTLKTFTLGVFDKIAGGV
jgi:flagellar biosynthetic protein FliQ